MEQNDASDVWARLATEGKAPTDLTQASQSLPSYTVGFGDWIDRLAATYLGDLCRRGAHFKLALAPYGGGKTHFLLALGVRALEENFAVAYVPCSSDVSLDSGLRVYKEFAEQLQLPGRERAGLPTFLQATVERKIAAIEGHGAPDPSAAFQQWTATVRKSDYPENAFGRVMAVALEAERGGRDSALGEAAVRWLQGDVGTLTRAEMQELRLNRVPKAGEKRFGRDLLLSLVRFLPEAGVFGLVLLFDEVETLFEVSRGQKANRVLAAMRVLLDAPSGVRGGLPLLGVFSATPDVLDGLSRYPALEQRLAVHGAEFQEGNDLSPQLPLDRVESQETLLEEIGAKLIKMGSIAKGFPFDFELQRRNARRLAQVASERNLDVNARRLFVKTWVSLLDFQTRDGERAFDNDELHQRYNGSFDQVQQSEGFEP